MAALKNATLTLPVLYNAGNAGDVILHKNAVAVVGEDDLDMDDDDDDGRKASSDKSVSVASTTQAHANNEPSRSETEKDKEVRRLRNTVCDRDDEISDLKRQLEDAHEQIKHLKEAQLRENEETPSGCFSIVARRSKARRAPATRAESRKKAV